jgi:hypothetical protein
MRKIVMNRPARVSKKLITQQPSYIPSYVELASSVDNTPIFKVNFKN